MANFNLNNNPVTRVFKIVANGWCKHCVGTTVLIPTSIVFCETVNPTCLPMRAGAELGAGFAFAIVLFS